MTDLENKDREEIFSKAVRAGKRTYFFDVKENRSGNHYIAITESIRRFDEEQDKFFYTKHKIFLYREDFNAFLEALNTSVKFIEDGSVPVSNSVSDSETNTDSADSDTTNTAQSEVKEADENFKPLSSDINFEDLDTIK